MLQDGWTDIRTRKLVIEMLRNQSKEKKQNTSIIEDYVGIIVNQEFRRTPHTSLKGKGQGNEIIDRRIFTLWGY